MTENSYKLFWPQPIGPYEADLQSFLKTFERMPTQIEKIGSIRTFLDHLPFYPNCETEKLRCKAFLKVLEDLIRQRWNSDIRQGKLYIAPPDLSRKPTNNDEVRACKEISRQSLKWERDAQFEKESVVEFIRYMEQERPFNGQLISIRYLIGNGTKLAEKLRKTITIQSGSEQNNLLNIHQVIQPYLCLINRGERCPYTGYLLQDIWRYFRYTWATPYNSTPGRQMFYLVRDAAQPFHPVIGIAALGSSMVQLTARDYAIGWTPKAFEYRILSGNFTDANAALLASTLQNILVEALDDIATEDLVPADHLSHPSEAIFNQLVILEKNSREKRIALLKKNLELDLGQIIKNQMLLFNSDTSNSEGDQEPDGELDDASDALYRAKRAGVLRNLLEAKMALDQVGEGITSAIGLQQFWKTSAGQKAICTLIRENKKRHVGINMMDIIVCGAIPPYNYLLGGKLVSMLLVSPQVIQDYYTKYSGYASTIASRMKGQDVKRDARLVFLGTTSLYDSGSSQYNRISIPIPDKHTEKISYINFGLTEGYGSVHFSLETVELLSELCSRVDEARLINNRFGEGVNPKLRRVRSGLSALGISSADRYLKHRSQRIVYGIPLGCSSFEFLRGETTDPNYYFSMNSPEEVRSATQYITSYWIDRWLLRRIQTPSILEELENFSQERVLISSEFTPEKASFIQKAMKF